MSEERESMKPTVGRIVLYNHFGKWVPSIITNVWEREFPDGATGVNLVIFNDSDVNDDRDPGYVYSRREDEAIGEWKWPERFDAIRKDPWVGDDSGHNPFDGPFDWPVSSGNPHRAAQRPPAEPIFKQQTNDCEIERPAKPVFKEQAEIRTWP
jgi:hypothetical protein